MVLGIALGVHWLVTGPDEPDISDEVTSFVGVPIGAQSPGMCMLVIGSSPSGHDRPWSQDLQHSDEISSMDLCRGC